MNLTPQELVGGLGGALTLAGMAATARRAPAGQPAYARIVRNLHAAGVPLRELKGAGCAAITPAAGRVVAMAFEPDGENLFWSNPQLEDTARVRDAPAQLVGGMGGDRLWFAPELDYHWDGAPDWNTFGNNHTPAASDPGAYRFDDGTPGAVVLRGAGELTSFGSGRRVAFEVERAVRLAPAPTAAGNPLPADVRYAGIETRHRLRLSAATREGRMDLWHLLQVPVGSVLVVPFRAGAPAEARRPLSYARPGAWEERPDQVRWRYGGAANAKFGLSAAALTGRSGVLRRLADGTVLLLVREFEVDPQAAYCDHPFQTPRDDQAFQAWDGYGFGEMEFHSPALDAQRGPRERTETDRLWAFGGPDRAIQRLAEALLGVDVRDAPGR